MTRNEIITEMLRLNGQSTCVESPVARLYMSRVYEFVRLNQVGDPDSDDSSPSMTCSHAPPPRSGRDGEEIRCTCGKFTYRWGWKGTMEGRGWRLL